MFFMACLGVWQFDFIVTAIEANVFLNLTIFATFAFGTFFAYRNVMTLKNEFIAFESLKEDYDDAMNAGKHGEVDVSWRFYRCNEQAMVFSKPEIMEQPFQIISAEIARNNGLSMSTGVMQNLIDSIDDRLDERKSLIQYVTGILVFLGLIGTFVGLMVTLGSVGDIIGSLDLSGGAGADAIQGLMNDLKIPLQGMATGFSSSLFGLVTSLALGLMARFSSRAGSSLRTEFETWAAGAAKVDSVGGGSSAPYSPTSLQRQISMMYRVARVALVSNAKVASSVDQMAHSIEHIASVQSENNAVTQTFADALMQIADSQALTNQALNAVAENLETRKDLASLLNTLKTDTQKNAESTERVQQWLNRLTQRQYDLHQRAEQNQKHWVQRDELAWLMKDAQARLEGNFTKLNSGVENFGKFLREINDNMDRNSITMRLSQEELSKQSQALGSEIKMAVAETKLAIEAAKEEEEQLKSKEKEDGSISGLKRKLMGSFSSSKNLEEPDDDQPVKPEPKLRRRGFNPFRKSA